MKIIKVRPGKHVYIGLEGEHNARQIRFDLSDWLRTYGDGTAQLIYQRPGDTAPYPVTLEREGSFALWTVTSTDTAQAGRDGRAELRYYVGDVLAKSEIYFISVGRALTAPGEVPEPPGKSWLDQALEAARRVEQAAGGVVPDYVKEEADRVAAAILALQNEHTFTFACVSDTHVNCGLSYAAQTRESAAHAAMAVKQVAAQVGLDFVVNLGDNLWGANSDVAQAKQENLVVNQVLYDAFRSHPNFRLVGNHDANRWNACIPTAAVYAMNGRYNQYDSTGATRMRGYGYRDFAQHKLRVIALNTSDYLNNKGGYALSEEQKLWLMESLDLSDKSDAEQWQILLLSHFPLDFPSSDYQTHTDVPAILTAYQQGKTVTIAAGGYDYFGKNKARIIADIHGHLHNFSRGAMADSGVIRVCTPNTCFYNSGSSGIEADERYRPNEVINKTAGTAQDTTVTFYTVDMEKMVIYSTNYGAGYDREISYAGTAPKQACWITSVLSHVSSSSGTAAVLEGEAYRTVLSADSGYTLEGAEITVTMGGTDVTAAVYADGVIHIPAVTGAVNIAASAAKEGEFRQVVEDLAGAVRQAFYLKNGAFDVQSDNQKLILGCSTENGHGWETRESTTVYLIPVPARSSAVTVATTDSRWTKMGIALITEENGVYISVNPGWLELGSYTFAPGSAEYMAINLLAQENAPWGYDTKANVQLTFT